MKIIVQIIAFMFLLQGCGNFSPSVNDTAYLKAIDLISEGKLVESKPFLVQNCKKGMLAACRAMGETIEREQLEPVSIMQGATTETQTQINFVLPVNEKIKILVWENGSLVSNSRIENAEVSRADSDWKVYKLKIKNMDLKNSYSLDVLGENSKLLDTRTFSALKTSGKQLRFAVASCMSDDYEKEQLQIWPELLEQKPEVIFLIGDNVYGDWVDGVGIPTGATPQILWRRYRQTWNALALYKTPHLVPVYGQWDDHDYGIDNGDKNFAHKKEAKQIFEAYFAQTPQDNIIKGPGTSYILKLRNQVFYFFDNRSFRDAFEDKQGSHFGKEQEKWFASNLKSHKRPSWLIEGDQFFGGYQDVESYEGLHPKSFKKFLDEIAKSKRLVAFVSGDRHLTELMKIPRKPLSFETYEFTTSGIHAKMYPGTLKKFPNPRGIAGVDGTLNYMIFNSEAVNRNALKIKVDTLTLGKKVLFSKELNIGK